MDMVKEKDSLDQDGVGEVGNKRESLRALWAH